jgi:hypothetical protein
MKPKIQRLYQTINRPLIIKLFFPSLLLLFSFKSGEGTGGPKLPVIRKEVKVEAPFQRACIDGDISMILTNEPAGTLMMEGNEEAVNKIRYSVKNNELIIDAHRKNRLGELTIYLSAATLKSMLVNGDAHISSIDIIKPDNLQIWLNGNINVKVKTTGKVSIDAYPGYDLFWDHPLMHNRN